MKKSIKELLELLHENVHEIGSKSVPGLCALTVLLYERRLMTNEQYFRLIKYIKKNRPSMFSSRDAFKQSYHGEVFYWTPGNIPFRKKWLEKHIKKNS